MLSPKKQFKLIGVRPLKGCATHIRKILKEDTTYFLYNDYQVDPQNPENIVYSAENSLPSNFFSSLHTSNKETPVINISAIVGKNGDGKSALVELIIRIINNFAYAAGYSFYQNELNAIKGLKAILYFSIADEVYYIKANGNSITSNLFKEEFSLKNPKIDNKLLKKTVGLFYTQITNFSLYAYNAHEFKHENTKSNADCWINGIFHKNDAYQTPIVLNPWRDDGDININRENSLMLQRLISLFVDSENDENSFRNIDNKKEAKFLQLNIKNESKLVTKTYEEYFVYSLSSLENHFLSIINDAKEEKRFSKGKISSHFKEHHLSPLEDIKNIIVDNRMDFDFAYLVIKKISSKSKMRKADFNNYLYQLNDYLKSIDSPEKDNYLELISFFTVNNYNQLNLLQLQRIITVVAIRNLWHKKYPKHFTQETTYGNDLYSLTEQYIIYKTISIILKYPQFRKSNNIQVQDTFNSLFLFTSQYNNIEQSHNEAFGEILKDVQDRKSHITLKLRQALNFLVYNQQKRNAYIKETDINKDFFLSLKLEKKGYKNIPHIIELSDYKRRIEKSIKKDVADIIEFLPPPIFNVNIVFQHKSINEYSYLSDFSSGERQLLNNISSVIYHLRNINSVSNSELVKYKYVTLIFEEIELYFHPEYQRKYIDVLLQNIQKVKLDSIDSINICFITHSPFILSDIPNNNILKLEKGISKPFVVSDNTLGANIHDLLANDFFLEHGFMGEFAKKRITDVINALKKVILERNIEREQSKENTGGAIIKELKDELSTLGNNLLTESECKNIIEVVGEPLLKNSLLELYAEAYPNDKNTYLQKQIDFLMSLKSKK